MRDLTRRWTTEEILALKPCARWDRAAIDAILGPTGLSLRAILTRDDVTVSDRLWVGWHLLSPDARRMALTTIVTRAVTTHARACGVPSVEIWADRWLTGVNRTEAAAEVAAAEAARAVVAAWTAAAPAAAWAAEETELRAQLADMLVAHDAEDDR